MRAMDSLQRVVEVIGGPNSPIAGDVYFWVRCYMEDAHNVMSFREYLEQTYLEQTKGVQCQTSGINSRNRAG